MAVDDDCGAQDEIKEFKHEGELDPHTDALLDIKNALVRAADKPPLVAALDYLSQIKDSAGISSVVIEVANRIKHEQFLKNRTYQVNKAPPGSHPYYTSPSTSTTTPATSSKAPSSGGIDGGRRSVNTPYIPNVNAANFQQPFPQPNWSGSPASVAASAMAGFSPQQRQVYYNMHFPQPSHPFGQTSGTQLLTSAQQNTPSAAATSAANTEPAPPTKTKTSKAKKKSTHIKKPLNAFMLYMKEMRAKVVQEYTLKESAAINQILGKRWHALDRSEQARFYEMARRERQLHMQMYPNWSARSNYATGGKKKRKRDKTAEQDAGSPKKCRARYGLDKQSSWCKPCRRKKKCVRYMQGELDHGCCDAGEHHKPTCPAAGAGTHEPGCAAGPGEGAGGGSCDCNTHTCGKGEEERDCTCKEDFHQLAALSLVGRDQPPERKGPGEGNVFQGGGFYPPPGHPSQSHQLHEFANSTSGQPGSVLGFPM